VSKSVGVFKAALTTVGICKMNSAELPTEYETDKCDPKYALGADRTCLACSHQLLFY